MSADLRPRSRRPLVPLAAGFALGIALPPSVPATWAGAAVLPLVLSVRMAPLAVVGAGVLATRLVEPRAEATSAGADPEVVDGRVETVPDRLDDRARFLLRDQAGRLLEVTAPEPVWPLALGDRVRLAVHLRPPQGPLNPSSRDRAASARAHGIALQASGWERPVRTAPPSPLAAVEAGRTRFAMAASAALPSREAALVRAIGSGDQSAVDPDTLDAFARSGLVHILSVSGLHLALIASGLFWMVRALTIRWDALAERADPRRVAALVAIPATVFYALATGAQVPIVRSALAAGAVFVGILLDREGDLLNSLALAALAILAAEPGALLDISFQLSFSSVAGLALLSGRLRRALPVPAPSPGARGLVQRGREMLLGAACASLAATVATGPLVAFHFRRIGLLAIPANLAGVPIGSALTCVSALAALAAGVWPPLAVPLLLLARPLASALLWVNDVFAAPRWAVVGLASPGLWGLLACYGLLLASLSIGGRWRVALLTGALAAMVLPGPARRWAAQRRGGLEVVFLAVGQGDGAVLRLPDGSGVVIDAGGEAQGRWDPGAREVVPFLRDAGVDRIAAAFISHPHPDHMLGMPAVAAALPVEHLFTNGRSGDADVQGAWARLPAPERLAAGDVFTRAGVEVTVLGPPAENEALSDNDASLVLRVRYGQTVFLFTGDLGDEGEQTLAGLVQADVVKVPHHGSSSGSSPGLVQAVGARWAVFSLAPGNRFGFPRPEVVERWRASGAEVLRTDEGAIRFLSDGRSVQRLDAAGAIDAFALWAERSLLRQAAPDAATSSDACIPSADEHGGNRPRGAGGAHRAAHPPGRASRRLPARAQLLPRRAGPRAALLGPGGGGPGRHAGAERVPALPRRSDRALASREPLAGLSARPLTQTVGAGRGAAR
jgi:competence protein ComEC